MTDSIWKFFRIEIPGYIAVFYALLGISIFIDDWQFLSPNSLSIYSVGFLVSIPIGYIMHQIAVDYYYNNVSSKDSAKKLIELEATIINSERINQIESWKYLMKERSNRMSHYYARWTVSILSPIFAFIFGIIISVIHGSDNIYINEYKLMLFVVLIIIIVILSKFVSLRLQQINEEIELLEEQMEKF
ncbi:MAG: hypothetical protein ACFFC1_09090 [Promethearchaeota archaeon]